MSRKVVFLLGAGASVADAMGRPPRDRPPLDRGFFAVASSTNPALTEDVARYMRDVYAVDPRTPRYDSLETVMGLIYPDLFNPALEAGALDAFRSLLRLFTRRLADTTDNLGATNRRRLYRMLRRYLLHHRASPADITIITFNQDLQVEKTLELMSRSPQWEHIAQDLFCFPHLYGADVWEAISRPPSTQPVFTVSASPRPACLHVLKLHGSLNWFSVHENERLAPAAMFDPHRELRITPRRSIPPSMTFKRQFTLPVLVPPVTHKSAVLHEKLKMMWNLAEARLEEADELIIFGYSCPALDFESSNLLRRAQRRRLERRTVVIDPNGVVASRYIDVLEPRSLDYFVSAEAFLQRR